METLTQDNFAEKVYTSDKIVVVQFTANWCSICQEMQPMINQLEQSHQKLAMFTKIDVDVDSELADRYNINKLPTFLFFKKRDIIDSIIGYEPMVRFKNIIENAQK